MATRWLYTADQLTDAVRQSTSIRQVLTRLGLSNQGGGAYATVRRRIEELGLDTTHFDGRGWNRGARYRPPRPATPLSELLSYPSPVTNFGRLKSRLIRDGLLRNVCSVCGAPPVWRDQPLVLRLDHINGIRNDNRLQNLRLVCPNCDSQLPTFAGRNRRRAPRAPAPPEDGSA